MRIALISASPKKGLYPIGLLKIGAMLKDRGDDCKLYNGTLPKVNEADEIWVSTVFSFDIAHDLGIILEAKNRCPVVRAGGVSATLFPERFIKAGALVHKGIMPEAEKYNSDFTLLDYIPKQSITHTSRGCVRKCEFCMVPKVEPKFTQRKIWPGDIHKDSEEILFYDNNWLAKKSADIQKDVEKMGEVVAQTNIRKIDFNQGLDCRLFTKEKAAILKSIPFDPMRFAFDGMHEDGHFQKAVRLVAEISRWNIYSYVLYNFTDTPQDLYYRLRTMVELQKETGLDLVAFPMKYQPIAVNAKKGEHIGRHWTRQKLNNFKYIIGRASAGGQISIHKIDEFEYWFTNSAENFDKLLSYQGCKKYADKKQGALRYKRATGPSVELLRGYNGAK
jgi:hypothetical protein